MPRKGRKRQPGDRYPSGDLRPRNDRGSERRQKERELLVGAGNDATKADSPLGVMLARGLITEPMYDAGEEYARLSRIKIGSPHPPAQQLHASSRAHLNGEGDERWRVDAEIRLRECDGRLGVYRHSLRRVCVHEQAPQWLCALVWMRDHGHAHPLSARNERERDDLLAGLTILAGWMYGRRAA